VCSTGKNVNTLLATPLGIDLVSQPIFLSCMGSQCDIDKKNVIMVNIEELSEEDQRKYTEMQEYIKQEFLSGAKKDRSSKLTLNQDFELPAIKLNKDKVEVIPTVSQTSPLDLVTRLSNITDRFERAFND
jgi:hypothetical protein